MKDGLAIEVLLYVVVRYLGASGASRFFGFPKLSLCRVLAAACACHVATRKPPIGTGMSAIRT